MFLNLGMDVPNLVNAINYSLLQGWPHRAVVKFISKEVIA